MPRSGSIWVFKPWRVVRKSGSVRNCSMFQCCVRRPPSWCRKRMPVRLHLLLRAFFQRDSQRQIHKRKHIGYRSANGTGRGVRTSKNRRICIGYNALGFRQLSVWSKVRIHGHRPSNYCHRWKNGWNIPGILFYSSRHSAGILFYRWPAGLIPWWGLQRRNSGML